MSMIQEQLQYAKHYDNGLLESIVRFGRQAMTALLYTFWDRPPVLLLPIITSVYFTIICYYLYIIIVLLDQVPKL